MSSFHDGPMRAIGYLHTSVSLCRQPRYGCPMPCSVITSYSGRQVDTYLPPTHIHIETFFRPLHHQVGPDIQIRPTPSSRSLLLTAVRHQGSRSDPSRYSSFCSTKLFRWLVDQSCILYQRRPCLSDCSIKVNGVSSNKANKLTR